jgi:Ribosomal RNA adenine dimethylase
MNSMFPVVADILPEGTSGRVRIEHFTVTEKDAEFTALRAAFKGRDEYVAPGRYVRLYVGGELMMSDTGMEKRSNVEVVSRAKGHVLIAGLGIGMITHPIAAKKEVKSITIVEKSPDVIKLVAPTLHKKVTVVEGDIFTWVPPKTKYDTLYFDIWAGICTDNLDDIAKLNRRFARYKAQGAWSDSWQRDLLLHRRRQESRYG